MQQSQRTRFNHALEFAIEQANALNRPLVVGFGLMDDYPEANERHYAFMLQGLRDVERALRERRIQFVIRRGSPPRVALHLASEAAIVVCDRGYLRHQKRWRDQVADRARCRVVQVESDVVVPVEVASDKHEFAARTIRPKIHRHWKKYVVNLPAGRVRHSSLDLGLSSEIDLSDVSAALAQLKLDRSVKPTDRLGGGAGAARRLLKRFIRHRLAGYEESRNDPSAEATSMMSAYLHFGQISPIEIALEVLKSRAPSQARDALLEELIVRRELAVNFVNFHPKYDTYDCLPEWAKKTLVAHRTDKRPYRYTRGQLEAAQTHDRYWNAAQLEMTRTGYMHNYMRMYWGKKILEWTRAPDEAFAVTLYLNNKYFLDGRDPNSYANVAWIFGLHDRPWSRRPIFGTVRYMNAAGLERKFDMDAYVRFVESL
jgi:deoxyribodipyrimidine photo-lyase